VNRLGRYVYCWFVAIVLVVGGCFMGIDVFYEKSLEHEATVFLGGVAGVILGMGWFYLCQLSEPLVKLAYYKIRKRPVSFIELLKK